MGKSEPLDTSIIGIYWKWDSPDVQDDMAIIAVHFWSPCLHDLDDDPAPTFTMSRNQLSELQLNMGLVGFSIRLHGPTDDNEYDLPAADELKMVDAWIERNKKKPYSNKVGCIVLIVITIIIFLLGGWLL